MTVTGPPVGYGAVLSAAWQRHLAPRAPDAPTVASTFSGMGGSCLGYSMAGYRELLAIDWTAHAARMLRTNLHPDVDVIHGDITQLDPARLPLARGELDLLDGSPPCQAMSVAGLRRLEDPRNALFFEFIRLIEAWAPRTFVAENVAGMVVGKTKVLFTEILAALKAARPGYRVTARILNASYLGVPQARRRMIFVGVREDLGYVPVHPGPTSRQPMTVRQAWADLKAPGDSPPLRGRALALAPYIKQGQDGADPIVERGGKRTYFNLSRLAFDKPATTLLHTIRPHTTGTLHPTFNRYLGTAELCRLQGVPDEYDWAGSSPLLTWERVGNSVPPPLAEAVGREIRDRILTPYHRERT